MKGEADVVSVDNNEGCHKLKQVRLSLHFKSYEVK